MMSNQGDPGRHLIQAPADDLSDALERAGARLRLIDRIEPGFGVVPVFEEGGVLLRKGEVAVYREAQSWELESGLYCLERQRPVAPQPDCHREISREVVYARPFSRRRSPDDDSWEYVSLRSKVVGGIRRYAVLEGPLYRWALAELLLGPVIGIYAPAPLAAAD